MACGESRWRVRLVWLVVADDSRSVDDARTGGDARQERTFPKIAWMLWMQGWEEAPELVRMCRASWEARNVDWDIRPLALGDVADVVDLRATFPEAPLDLLPRPALSDLIRLALLDSYGGA